MKREHDSEASASPGGAALTGEEWEDRCALALANLPEMPVPRLRCIVRAQAPSTAWAALRAGKLPQAARVRFVAQDQRRRSASATARARVRESRAVERESDWIQAARRMDVEEVVQRYRDAGVGFVRMGSTSFPKCLEGDPQAPPVLYFRSGTGLTPDQLAQGRVAIVGTRHCTGYGYEVARQIGRDLTEAGVSVISGLAVGIDHAAHKGALETSGGPPIGIVGTGLDVIYPSKARGMWDQIGKVGMLATEQPLGAPPEAWHFPARNRIIAALSQVVVVIESKRDGGAMTTAEAAAARGIPVLAVPGSVRSLASSGTNELLHEGCGVARDAADVLTALSIEMASRRIWHGDPEEELPSDLDESERRILVLVDWAPTPTTTIMDKCPDIGVGGISLTLQKLEARGLVNQGAGWWERTSRIVPEAAIPRLR